MEGTGFIKRFSQPEGIREEMITDLRVGETERGWLAQDHTAASWYLRQGFPQRLPLRVGRPGRGSRPRLVLAEGVIRTGGRTVSSILLVGPVGCLTGQAAPLTCFAVPVLPYLPRALPSHCTVGWHSDWFPFLRAPRWWEGVVSPEPGSLLSLCPCGGALWAGLSFLPHHAAPSPGP